VLNFKLRVAGLRKNIRPLPGVSSTYPLDEKVQGNEEQRAPSSSCP
jgi:hypothetical protein